MTRGLPNRQQSVRQAVPDERDERHRTGLKDHT
jgi:hypothetical protein